MSRRERKHSPLLKNRLFSRTLSLILSTAVVLLPVWPAGASDRRASAGNASPARFAYLPEPVAALAAPAVPSLSVTKVDSFNDTGSDGKAEPGQDITYTLTITNNGTDATNVVLTDTIDLNTTLIAGSVKTQPVAANDAYNVLGNVRIQPGAGAGLLSNDCDPDPAGGPCSGAGLTASGPSLSSAGGNVTVNPNGSFSYNPPPGFEGIDTFSYMVTDATGLTDTATVTLSVNDVVWFVNNAAPSGGDGRLTSPFNSLASLGGADPDEPGDVIFVHQGSGSYGGGITLEDNQKLVGQGTSLDAALATFGISVPAHSDARPASAGRPSLANSGGNVITLANGNAVLHVEATATALSSSAVYGSNVNGLTLSNSKLNGTGGSNSFTAPNECGIRLANLIGSATISSSEIANGARENLCVTNSSGTLDRLSLTGNTFGFVGASLGEDNFHMEASGAGTVAKVTISGNTFNGTRGDFIETIANGDSTMDVVVRENRFDDGQAILPGGGTAVSIRGDSAGTAATVTYDISCNRLDGNTANSYDAVGIFVAKGDGAGSFSGTIVNNLIGPANTAAGAADGLFVRAAGSGTFSTLIQNNQLSGYSSAGIHLQNNDGSATLNAALYGNTTTSPAGFAFAGLFIDNGATGTDTSTTNVVVGSATDNALKNDFSAGDPSEFGDIYIFNNLPTTALNLSLNGSTGTTSTDVLQENNHNGATTTVLAFDAATMNSDVNLVSTLPSTPAAPASCSLAATLEGVDFLGYTQNREVAAAPRAPGKFGRVLSHSDDARLLSFNSLASPAAYAPSVAASGGDVSVQIGTLRAGDSVTVTFDVTVADPFPSAVQPPRVSNQATVTADGGISVLSDDPSVGGSADPTVTPVLTPPTISINDSTVAEPATGSASALFTVSLSQPYTQTVSVNFQTASGGANPATAGTDYTTTSGSISFAAGETLQTISVPVLADGNAAEGNEHFIVNLSSPGNGTIGDGQANGTITDETATSAVVISELRTSGPNGSADDFVELLNTTDAPITVAASDASAGWSIVKSGVDCSTTPVVVGLVPNGTVIPARGNYLLTGSAYSLNNYGGIAAATGDANLSADIESDSNVGLFTTASVAGLSSVTRLDAVGFGANTDNNCDLLREGSNLPAAAGSASEHSFVREVTKGLTADTGDNAADFIAVSTTPAVNVGSNTPVLGAPGPERLSSPKGPVPCSASAGSSLFGRVPVDASVGVGQSPNTVREGAVVANGANGTIEFRRTFTNNTGASVTALRFRIVGLSTNPAAPGTADLRALNSTATIVTTAGGPVTVQGTTVETPPAQALGGGVNSSLTFILGSPLADGASVNLRFLFGVEQTGDYDIAFVIESSPSSGKDIWELSGHTEDGGHADGGCNSPPVADAGDDQMVECVDGEATVTLDGSGSSDPDGDALTYEWKEGSDLLGTTQTLNVTLPLGSHTITLTVTDPSGASSQDEVVVVVQDTMPPVINCPGDIIEYLLPNTSDVTRQVNFSVTATDSCDSDVPVVSTPPSGSTFGIGITPVNSTAEDDAGNDASCTFNVWVQFKFTGFFSPISNTPAVNTVQAGRAIPVKFSLSGNKGLNIFETGYPASTEVACDTGVPESEVPTVTAGGSSLTYNASTDTYSYIWKTESSWAGTCRRLIVKLKDGTTHVANFKFR